MAVTFFATLTSSCADGDLNSANGGGSIWGDIGGESVPSFGSAAFGLLASSAETTLVGHLLPGDSCRDGAEFSRTSTEDEAAEVLSRVVPDGSWFGAVTLIVADLADFGDSGFEPPEHAVDLIGTRDGTVLFIKICKQSASPECFVARSGGFYVDVAAEDPQELRIRDTSPARTVTMRPGDSTGEAAGYVDVDLSFSRCEAIDEAVAAP